MSTRPMTLNEYTAGAAKTAGKCVQYDNDLRFAYVAMGLAGEAGEIANKAKKIYRDDGGKMTPERRVQMFAELGDVLWYWAMACKVFNIDPEEVARFNLAKLAKRQAEGTIGGDGDNR